MLRSPRMRWLWIVMLAACVQGNPPGAGGTSRSARMEIPMPGTNQLDILIVVDNSPAMSEHATQVANAGTTLGQLLMTFPGGTPDLHIGVATGDCNSNRLTTGMAPVTGNYMTDAPQSDGTRTKNYTGALDRTISQLMNVGTSGCVAQTPLAAATRVLGSTTSPGFLREKAYLLVVVVTAIDDSSSEIPEAYAEALKALKTDPGKVLFTTIDGQVPGDPGCTAAPAPRLQATTMQFPNRGGNGPLCGASDIAFSVLLSVPHTTLAVPCWDVPLDDRDLASPGLQPECSAELVMPDGAAALFPRCTPGTTEPCYRIYDEMQACVPPNLATKIDRIDALRGTGGKVVIECLVSEELP